MRVFTCFVAILSAFLVSCVRTSKAPVARAQFSVDREFPGGESVLAAAKRVLPECRYISLAQPNLGSDARYDYAMFFVGRETHGGFEGIYYRYLVFAKLKTAPDWSSARVFDWPGDFVDPFKGPIERLEKEGRELGKRPNQTPEPTPLAVTPRADARVAPSSVVAHL